MYATNPRHKRHRRHHRRHHHHGFRHNPGPVAALEDTFKHPTHAIADGGVGIVSAFMTVALPNFLLPFPGVDLMSKLLRLATRVAAGGLVVLAGDKLGYRAPAMAGAAIGSLGAGVLDLLGTRIVLGAGDTGQTPMTLLQSVTLPTGAAGYYDGMGGYVGSRALPRALTGYVGTRQVARGTTRHAGMHGYQFSANDMSQTGGGVLSRVSTF